MESMTKGEERVTEKISPHQHIVELKELMNLLLERAALEAYRGNLQRAERYLLGAERAIWETIEIVRESRG